jgi:hypothetical protein
MTFPEARSGNNPEEIGPNVMKIRKDHEGKTEAILSNSKGHSKRKYVLSNRPGITSRSHTGLGTAR